MQQSSNPSVPKILPPHIFLATVVLMLVAGYLETSLFGNRYWPLALCLVGIWLAAREKNRFVRAGTTFYPGDTASKLITDGAYRYSRNPMYLGMVVALIGLWPLTDGYVPGILLVIFAGIITKFYIVPEEKHLTERFGQDYLDYKRSVRRWL
ncbi:MAG: isoprenylcysteine carboxylmethyltransferase family protein [Alphaproteobacteria bacterium]|nr:isoprenylcysteine carboxylmethyltransferase family protein [Alphaproteobacteria bacterium]